MSDSIFCPFCHHKNKPDATHCVHCATPLNASKLHARSTLRVSDEQAVATQKSIRCSDYATKLPKDALALFIREEQEPIVIQNTQEAILGRGEDRSSGLFVDLTPFGAEELGVSRRHVRISHTDGVWSIVDLASTNGTWLNRLQLIPSESYELQSSDDLWLGRLRLLACFGIGRAVSETVLYIKDTSIAATAHRQLTPGYLGTNIIPYLEAIVEIEQIYRECRGESSEEIYVNSINAKDDFIFVSLDGAPDGVELTQRWLTPSRKRLLAASEAKGLNSDVTPEHELVELGKQILADIAPGIANEELVSYQERLLRSLSLLAKSPLELIQ